MANLVRRRKSPVLCGEFLCNGDAATWAINHSRHLEARLVGGDRIWFIDFETDLPRKQIDSQWKKAINIECSRRNANAVTPKGA
jgi:hypothetical protein